MNAKQRRKRRRAALPRSTREYYGERRLMRIAMAPQIVEQMAWLQQRMERLTRGADPMFRKITKEDFR